MKFPNLPKSKFSQPLVTLWAVTVRRKVGAEVCCRRAHKGRLPELYGVEQVYERVKSAAVASTSHEEARG